MFTYCVRMREGEQGNGGGGFGVGGGGWVQGGGGGEILGWKELDSAQGLRGAVKIEVEDNRGALQSEGKHLQIAVYIRQCIQQRL